MRERLIKKLSISFQRFTSRPQKLLTGLSHRHSMDEAKNQLCCLCRGEVWIFIEMSKVMEKIS
jgi:hypothetical protein